LKTQHKFPAALAFLVVFALSQFLAAQTAQIVPTSQACEARSNDTADKLVQCMQAASLWSHLSVFQSISDANPGQDGHGNRDAGTPGYKASVNFVAAQMRKAGYKVTIQTYQFFASDVVGTPQFDIAGQGFPADQWSVARLSAGGTLNAPVQPAGPSGTGCSQNEFSGFLPGNVALLERGACSYDTQVNHAAQAGAAGVILYNSPVMPAVNGADYGSAFQARLTRASKIPVIGVASYAIGSDLRDRYVNGAAPVAHLDIRIQPTSITDYNLIADSPLGDPTHVVVVDAHLDSIFGAGMLDNASGSTTILEIALKMANTSTRNQLRYIWFGGEELGLNGSAYYTNHLTQTQRNQIAFDIDADVTATPNFDYEIADPARAGNRNQFPPNVIPNSKVGNQFYTNFFTSQGVPSASAPFGNDGTDSNSFSLIGIPNTGILTRQDCCKDASEVQTWGGFQGNYEGNIPSFDGGCVDFPNRWCDNLSNNDPTVLELASRATAFVVLKMANFQFP
jgi:peptidase M28-like protein/PA domain-containing protein